jgi:GTP-binding protein HflX
MVRRAKSYPPRRNCYLRPDLGQAHPGSCSQTYGLKASQIKNRPVPAAPAADRLVTQVRAPALRDRSRRAASEQQLVDRSGSVGYDGRDALRIELPDFKRVRAGAGRLRGLRCIHTHLRGEPLTQDDLVDLQLLRLDAMVAVRVDAQGLPTVAEYATLTPPNGSGNTVERHPPQPPSRLDFDFGEWIDALEDRLSAQRKSVMVEGSGTRRSGRCLSRTDPAPTPPRGDEGSRAPPASPDR